MYKLHYCSRYEVISPVLKDSLEYTVAFIRGQGACAQGGTLKKGHTNKKREREREKGKTCLFISSVIDPFDVALCQNGAPGAEIPTYMYVDILTSGCIACLY